MVFFLANYMINFFLTNPDTAYEDKALASLSTHTAMTFACDVFLLVESEGVGINWSNLSR